MGVLVEAVKELRAEKDAQVRTLEAENATLQQQSALKQQIIEALTVEMVVQQELNQSLEARLAVLERTVGSPSAEINPTS